MAQPDIAKSTSIEWTRSPDPVAYDHAVRQMDAWVSTIFEGNGPERIWLLEHPALFTAGTSARAEDLLDANKFPVHKSGRGGQFTYHGPGQRIAYTMLDLRIRGRDVRAFVGKLEEWVIVTLARFGVVGERHQGRVGVWVARPELGPGHEAKIAAIGVRLRRWVSFHGLSLNVAPNLDHYQAIVPCGIAESGVTSLAELGIEASMEDVDKALAASFDQVF